MPRMVRRVAAMIEPKQRIRKSPDELAELCATVTEARNLIENAKRTGNEAVRIAAERRLYQLFGKRNTKPEDDELTRCVWEGIAAYEDIVLARKHGKRVAASRTRDFVRRHGPKEALLRWAQRTSPSEGFLALIEAGHPEHTAEYEVAVLFPEKFPAAAVESARKRLKEYGVELD
jgi:hypothetical protein